MGETMQRIPLERACRGMKLAKPLVNENGVTLIREGTQLTNPLLEKLRSLGIRNVIVQGHPLKDKGAIEKPLHVLEKELRDRFRPVQANPLMRQLREIFLEELRFREEEKEQ